MKELCGTLYLLSTASGFFVKTGFDALQSVCAYPDVRYYNKQTNLTKCYRAFTYKLDWPHAKVACRMWGGHLASINSADENSWVSNVLLPNSSEYDRAWIGMHSYETFGWNGISAVGKNGAYPQGILTASQPKSYPLHCGYIATYTGNWYSRECWANYSFVCQKTFKPVSEQEVITTTAPSVTTTTCSPFGVRASCNTTLLGQYGTVQQDRGTCLILGGIDTSATQLTWAASNTKCKSILNGDLVEVEDAIRWQAVSNLATIAQARGQAQGAWTGLQNYYRWTDGHRLTYIPSQSATLQSFYGLCYAFANTTGDYSSSYCSDTTAKLPYICQVPGCPVGMTTVPDCVSQNYICVEENECFSSKADCGGAGAALCVDLPHDLNQYKCVCQQGFKQSVPNDPRSPCVDVAECADPTICGAQVQGGVCIEQFGGYLCACKNGYRLAGNTSLSTQTAQYCTEVNECNEISGICGPGACVNVPGSYDCSCNAGYQFVNGKCIDINECALSVYPCGISTAQAFCINQAGYSSSWPKGFTCNCPRGYNFMLTTSTCAQMNNCQPNSASVCGSDPFARCVNYQQQFYCACAGGYNYNVIRQKCEAINLTPLIYGNGTLAVPSSSFFLR